MSNRLQLLYQQRPSDLLQVISTSLVADVLPRPTPALVSIPSSATISEAIQVYFLKLFIILFILASVSAFVFRLLISAFSRFSSRMELSLPPSLRCLRCSMGTSWKCSIFCATWFNVSWVKFARPRLRKSSSMLTYASPPILWKHSQATDMILG